MYKIAICEDEIIQLNTVKKLIENVSEKIKLEVYIDLFTSGEALMESKFEEYDIIILDIVMEGISGIEVAQIIRQRNEKTKIIFMTGLEAYWSEGYNVNAYRYLLKPINEKEFSDVITKLFHEMMKEKCFIILKEKKGTIERVNILDIKYLAIDNRKVNIHTIEGIYVTSTSLGEWNRRLQAYGFANPHTSYLVNLRYVKGMDKENVRLTTGESVYVSQRKYKEFKKRFIDYIDGHI